MKNIFNFIKYLINDIKETIYNIKWHLNMPPTKFISMRVKILDERLANIGGLRPSNNPFIIVISKERKNNIQITYNGFKGAIHSFTTNYNDFFKLFEIIEFYQ